MKKKLLAVLCLLVVITTIGILVGCDNGNEQPNNSEPPAQMQVEMELFFKEKVDAVATTKKIDIAKYQQDKNAKLYDVLKGEKNLQAHIDESTPNMPFITQINGLIPASTNQYISIFTNLQEFKDTSEWAPEPIVIGKTTFFSANKGIADLPIGKDAKYLFVIMSF